MPTIINNSTFLDAFGAGQYTSQQYQTVAAATLSTDARVIGDANQTITDLLQYGPTASTFSGVGRDTLVTVGLMLERAAPQSQLDNLLGGTWGQRHAALAAFPDQAALWATYGANTGTYNTVTAQIQTALAGIAGADPFTTAAAAGYISTAADRTIWLTLNPNQFTALFNSALFHVSNSLAGTTTLAWTGNLAFNDAISASSAAAIQGLWVESNAALTNPLVTASTLVAPTLGPLGVGHLGLHLYRQRFREGLPHDVQVDGQGCPRSVLPDRDARVLHHQGEPERDRRRQRPAEGGNGVQGHLHQVLPAGHQQRQPGRPDGGQRILLGRPRRQV